MRTITSHNPDHEEIKKLLVECGMASQHHDDPLATYLEVRAGRCLIGVGGLSACGAVGVFHSLAVLPAFRSIGVGHQLGKALVDLSRELELREVWVRTRGAAFFFRTLGFSVIHDTRDLPPEMNALEKHSLGLVEEYFRLPLVQEFQLAV